MVSYGLAYGMEAYGLGQRLNIATEEAAEILEAAGAVTADYYPAMLERLPAARVLHFCNPKEAELWLEGLEPFRKTA